MRALFCLVLVLNLGCKPSQESDLFTYGTPQGEFEPIVLEASGLVSSVKNKGHLWTINDSGNPAEIYLVNSKGEVILTCELNGIKNRDWEDIAIGPGAEKGSYLYVGDIGDNEAKYKYKYIYRVAEPALGDNKKQTIENFERFVVIIPDGMLDSEAMTVDPKTGDLYLFSKRKQENDVYRIGPDALVKADTILADKLGTIPFHNLVAADISRDGQEVLLKTYGEVLYWKLMKGESLNTLFFRDPVRLKYEPEPQGESIAWAADGSGYYTVSERREKEKPNLIFYKRVEP